MFKSFCQLFSLLTPAERKQSYWIFLAMWVMALIDVVGVASIMPFMAVVADSANIQSHAALAWLYHYWHFTSPHHFLIGLGLIVLGILLVNTVTTIGTTWLILRYTFLRDYNLSKRLLAKYLHQPYSFFLNRNTSELAKNILVEVKNIINEAFVPGMQMIARLLVALLLVLLLFLVEPLLALSLVFILGGAYTLIYLSVRHKLAAMSITSVKANEQRHKVANEALSGIKDIKLRGKESNFLQRYAVAAKQMAEDDALAYSIGLIPRYGLEAVAFSGILLIVIYFLMIKQSASDIISLLALYAFACFRLMPSLQLIFAAMAKLKVTAHAIDILYHDLKTYHPEPFAQYAPLSPLQHQLALKNITFSYPGTPKPVLMDLNLEIRANTTVGFVGSTGSGKTTTVDIILGLLQPQQGQLVIDGRVLTANDLNSWQRTIGYVPQAIYLTDDSVLQNIAFGVAPEEINYEAVIRAARIANIDEFITTQLPTSYDTLIGERGLRLSGGQRQRIGIARALYHDPAILILDEATSALDNITENAIMDAIRQLTHHKTIILIAHRLSTVKECDAIFFFEHGKITSQGTYEQLLAANSHFQDLVKGRT